MVDLIYLALIVGFFVLAVRYVIACDGLAKGGEDNK